MNLSLNRDICIANHQRGEPHVEECARRITSPEGFTPLVDYRWACVERMQSLCRRLCHIHKVPSIKSRTGIPIGSLPGERIEQPPAAGGQRMSKETMLDSNWGDSFT